MSEFSFATAPSKLNDSPVRRQSSLVTSISSNLIYEVVFFI